MCAFQVFAVLFVLLVLLMECTHFSFAVGAKCRRMWDGLLVTLIDRETSRSRSVVPSLSLTRAYRMPDLVVSQACRRRRACRRRGACRCRRSVSSFLPAPRLLFNAHRFVSEAVVPKMPSPFFLLCWNGGEPLTNRHSHIRDEPQVL